MNSAQDDYGQAGTRLARLGDYLEVTYYDAIAQHIPLYPMLWEIYIGNQGNPVKMIEQDMGSGESGEAAVLRRQTFAERLYTCIENWVLMNSITEKAKTPQKYEDVLIDFKAFFVCMGQVGDMLKKMSEDKYFAFTHYGDEGDWSQCRATYMDGMRMERNIILHGPKTPLGYMTDNTDAFYLMPKLAEDSRFGWNDMQTWDTAVIDDTSQALDDFYAERSRQIAELINLAIGKMLPVIQAHIQIYSMNVAEILASKDVAPTTEIIPEPSGIQGTPCD